MNVAFFFDGNPACLGYFSPAPAATFEFCQGTHVATGSMDNTAKLWDVGVAKKKDHREMVVVKILREVCSLVNIP